MRSIREYIEVSDPDSKQAITYDNFSDERFSTQRMEQDTFPYDILDTGEVIDDIDFASAIDSKADITKYRLSPPRKRMYEDVYTTGPMRHIGSPKGWSSSPEPLPGDDDPTYTLKDLFDEEERYMKRVERDVQVIEALRPRDIPLAITKRK